LYSKLSFSTNIKIIYRLLIYETIKIYRNCDSKGLVRYLICFKLAIVIAAILAGLISNPVQASENDFPKNSSLTPIEESYLKKRSITILKRNN